MYHMLGLWHRTVIGIGLGLVLVANPGPVGSEYIRCKYLHSLISANMGLKRDAYDSYKSKILKRTRPCLSRMID